MFLLSVRATLWGERRAKVTGHKRAIDQSAASPPVGNGATNHKPSLKGEKKNKKKKSSQAVSKHRSPYLPTRSRPLAPSISLGSRQPGFADSRSWRLQ